MPIRAGEYAEVLKAGGAALRWRHVVGEPDGVDEVVLHKQDDGSYTHLLRIGEGVELPEPITHDFHEEAFYIEGEMLNTKTRKVVRGGTYVYHRPGEPHGPFRCLRTCLILEFRYYK